MWHTWCRLQTHHSPSSTDVSASDVSLTQLTQLKLNCTERDSQSLVKNYYYYYYNSNTYKHSVYRFRSKIEQCTLRQ